MDLLERVLASTFGAPARRYAFEDRTVRSILIEEFDSAPNQGAITFVTTTVSRAILEQRGGRPLRQELLLACEERFRDRKPEKLLAAVAEMTLESHFALRQGEVLGPAGPLFPGSRLEAFYVTEPVLFPESLRAVIPTDPPTVIAWTIPIYPAEAWYVKTHGWEEFEKACVPVDPNFFDLERPIISLCKEGYESRDH